MFKPFLTPLNSLIQVFASKYLSNINVSSLPIWKGQVTIEDVKLNAEGLKEVLESNNTPCKIPKLNVSSITAKVPLFFPGKQPIVITIHSFDAEYEQIIEPPSSDKNISNEESTNQQDDNQTPASQDSQTSPDQSFLAKLTSNILILADGVSITFKIFGISIELVINDFRLHLLPNDTSIIGETIHGIIKSDDTSISLTADKLDIHIFNGTSVDIVNLAISASASGVYFDLTKSLYLKMFFGDEDGKGKMSFISKDPISLSVPIQILPAILQICSHFPPSMPSPWTSFPIIVAQFPELNLNISVSPQLSISVLIESIHLENNRLDLGPLSLLMEINENTSKIIDRVVFTGKLFEEKRILNLEIFSESLRVFLPLSNEFISVLSGLQFDNLKSQPNPNLITYKDVFDAIEKFHRPQSDYFEEEEITLKQLTDSNINNELKCITFEFEHPIIITAFRLDLPSELHRITEMMKLRIYEPTYSSFVAIASFQPDGMVTKFNLRDDQLIPSTRFQIFFPKSTELSSELLEHCTLTIQKSERLWNWFHFHAQIKELLVSIETEDFPIAAISLSKFDAQGNNGPFAASRFYASFGLSILLTNFRNSTMSPILDIPNLSATFVKHDWYGGLFNSSPDSIFSRLLQESYVGSGTSISLNVPSYSLNIIPSIIFDLIQLITSQFDVTAVAAYTISNVSDHSFYFEAGNREIRLQPGQDRVITFLKDQKHVIFFKAQSVKIPLCEHGIYRLTPHHFVSVDVDGPYRFRISIKSRIQFINNTSLPLEIRITSLANSPTFFQLQPTKFATTSDSIHMIRVRVPTVTQWSNEMDFSTFRSSYFPLECEVLNTKFNDSSSFLFSPLLNIWLISKIESLECSSQGDNNPIHSLEVMTVSFYPVLTIKNTLPFHLITSAGSIPPHSTKILFSLNQDPTRSNIFEVEGNPIMNLKLPLNNSNTIQSQQFIVGTLKAGIRFIPNIEENILIAVPFFVFRNRTDRIIHFKAYLGERVDINPHEQILLQSIVRPEWVSVGVDSLFYSKLNSGESSTHLSKSVSNFFNRTNRNSFHGSPSQDFSEDEIKWSPPLQKCTNRLISIKAPNGTASLVINFTDNEAEILPALAAINDSKEMLFMSESYALEPGKSVELEASRSGKVRIGLMPDQSYFVDIPIDKPVQWGRIFTLNGPGRQWHYFTYSVSASKNIFPQAIVFRDDPDPPFIISNRTNTNYEFPYNSNSIVSVATTDIYLPYVPPKIELSRPGCAAFAVPLAEPLAMVVTESQGPLFITVEQAPNQTKLILSRNSSSILNSTPREDSFDAQLYISEGKIYIFDDISTVGIPKQVLTITISPFSASSHISTSSIIFSGSLDGIQIDNVDIFDTFPVIIKKSNPSLPLFTLRTGIKKTFSGVPAIEHIYINLSPFQICVEESFVRLIVGIANACKSSSNNPIQTFDGSKISDFSSQCDDYWRTKRTKENGLAPRVIHNLFIKETQFLLSLSTQSFIDANFRQIPINLSGFSLSRAEVFDSELLQSIILHYTSDILAAIPSFLTSLSLIGNPGNFINQTLASFKTFYRTILQSDSFLSGLAKGSLVLLQEISTGVLGSAITFISSIGGSLSKFTPHQTQSHQSADENDLNTRVDLNNQGNLRGGAGTVINGVGQSVMAVFAIPTVAACSIIKKTGVALIHTLGKEEEGVEDGRIAKKPISLLMIVVADD